MNMTMRNQENTCETKKTHTKVAQDVPNNRLSLIIVK
jgi:hypothetical protein